MSRCGMYFSRLCSKHRALLKEKNVLLPVLATGSDWSAQLQLSHPARCISFWGTSKSKAIQPKGEGWHKAITEAEKVVGYTTSFMSLRCLLSDELSNIAMQMRKLVGTGHPLLHIAREFLFDGKHCMQMRGLIVLLISKAAGPVEHNGPEMNGSMTSGIYPTQRSVAEITEMIHTANLIHGALVDMTALPSSECRREDMHFGNKIAVLSGDYLLANTATALAELNNTKVVELMSSAIGDLVEAEFCIPTATPTGQHDVDDSADGRRATLLVQWNRHTQLAHANLVAKGCRSAMMLAGHRDELEQQAFLFGQHLVYARKLHDDLMPLINPPDFAAEGSANLSHSLPVLLHRCQTGHAAALVNTRQLQHELRDSDLLSELIDMCRDHGSKALKALGHFPASESTRTLTNMVHAVSTF